MNSIQAILRLRQVLRRQHKALSTESAYVYWLRQYIEAVRQMSWTISSQQKLERFLTNLACRRNVSASTQNQALNAMVFFYKEVLGQPIQDVDALRAKRPAHMRRAPTVRETQALLQTLRDEGGYEVCEISGLKQSDTRMLKRGRQNGSGPQQFNSQGNGCQRNGPTLAFIPLPIIPLTMIPLTTTTLPF